MTVRHTIPDRQGRVRRYRECQDCQRVVRTEERTLPVTTKRLLQNTQGD
jgi:RNA polymerase subunit RPABC4/transcription elongation factor Spt4